MTELKKDWAELIENESEAAFGLIEKMIETLYAREQAIKDPEKRIVAAAAHMGTILGVLRSLAAGHAAPPLVEWAAADSSLAFYADKLPAEMLKSPPK